MMTKGEFSPALSSRRKSSPLSSGISISRSNKSGFSSGISGRAVAALSASTTLYRSSRARRMPYRAVRSSSTIRMDRMRLPGRRGSGRRRGAKEHSEVRAPRRSRRAQTFDRAADFLRATRHDGQAQPCSPGARGEERQENFFAELKRDPGTLVLDAELDAAGRVAFPRQADPDRPAGRAHFERVHHEVRNDVARRFFPALDGTWRVG